MGLDIENNNFGNYLEDARRKHGVTVEELADGLCDFSLITRIESGERTSTMILRNRLLERIGATSGEYEKYVKVKEFKRWQERAEIIADIKNENYSEAENKIQIYFDGICEDRNLEEQFCLDVRAMIARISKSDEAYILAKEAMKKTVAIDKTGKVISRRLSPKEINLVIEYSQTMDVQMRREQLEYLLKYAENNIIDELNLVLFYPKLIYSYVTEFIEENVHNPKWLAKALSDTDRTLELLELTSRSIYIVELEQLRKRIWDTILSLNDCKNVSGYTLFLESIRKNESDMQLWADINQAYCIDMSTVDWCYLYKEDGVECLGNVIKKRRLMFGMSKEELCMDICSMDTIERIEKLKSDPKQQKVIKLFERLELMGEYQKTNISISNVEAKICEETIMRFANSGKYDEALQKISELKNIIKGKTSADNQFILMTEAMLKYKKHSISACDCYKFLEDALEYTISDYCVYDGYYMTRLELSCIYNMVMIQNGNIDNKIADVVTRICNIDDNQEILQDVGLMELYLLAAVKIYLARKNAEMAEKYNNFLIKMELREKRRFLLYQALNENILIHKLKKEQGLDIAENVILQNEKLIMELKPHRQNKELNKQTNKQTDIYKIIANINK